MPKGIFERKKKEEVVENVEVKAPEVKAEEVKEKPKSKELPPLPAGQKYFEAPDGEIVIGEDTKDHFWYRKGNGGKGCWINPKR